jgi:hypothetical protein
MIQHSRKVPVASAILVAIVFAVVSAGVPRQLFAADASSCAATPANRALDFWLGDWSVSAPGSAPNAASRISLDQDQCVVIERWDGGRGHTGANFFAYSSDEKIWRGMFTDNQGRVHIFPNGRAEPGRIQFSGSTPGLQGETILNRVTIRRIDENRVEQLWEKSSDGGKSWTDVFRGEYVRKRV